MPGPKPKDPQARFWPKVDKSGPPHPTLGTPCWLWTAFRASDGYARFGTRTKAESTTVYAHRFAYETLVSPIPEGLELDHLCRVRHCVNPAHLEPVTSRENTMRGDTITARNARKTHCPQGHPYAGGNLGICKGERYCRACRIPRDKARRSRA